MGSPALLSSKMVCEQQKPHLLNKIHKIFMPFYY